MELARSRQRHVPRASCWKPSTDVLPSREKNAQRTVGKMLSALLTVHDYIHITEETVDDFEYLRSGCPSLILREPV